MALTPKQQRFVDEYLVDLNATAAAERAGYSKRTAYSIGHENLKKPEIAAAISERRRRVADETGVTINWIVERLKQNVERSMQAEPVLDHEGNETGEYRYAGNVANRALELLGKWKGMFDTASDESHKSLTRLPIDLSGTDTTDEAAGDDRA